MATAERASFWRQGLATTTIRHFCRAVAFALAAVVVGMLLYAVETLLLRSERRFVENPASIMMRSCGLAHFWIGWLFLFTSPQLRSRKSWSRLLAWTALGAALCGVCALCGSSQNPFVFLFFYCFFLIHEIRDETTLYQRCGDAPRDGGSQLFLVAFRQAAVILLSSLLTMTYLLYALTAKRAALMGSLSPWYFLTLTFCLGCLSYQAYQRAAWCAVEHYGSLRRALSFHAPIALVYLGIFAVLVLGLVAGSLSFNLIILIHAGAWLVFVYDRLRRQPPPTRHNLWTWVRHTPTGFLTLHLVVIAFILLMTALRIYCWERVGFASELFAGANFPYWSLMHIAMSFWRPR